MDVPGDEGKRQFMDEIVRKELLVIYGIRLGILDDYRLPGALEHFEDARAEELLRQELFHAERYSEVDLSDNPDFVEVARSFGIEAFRVTRRDEVDAAIERLLSADGAILAHVCIDPKTNVWPLVPPGETNDVMLEGMSA